MKTNPQITALFQELFASMTLEKAVFSRPYDKHVKKAVAKLFTKGEALFCQIERFTDDNKAHHENLSVKEAPDVLAALTVNEFVQTDLYTTTGFCEILVSKKGHIHIADKREKTAEATKTALPAAHNRQKQYLLDPVLHAKFLSRLGVSDETGRVFEKKRSKFRQINRFLELFRDVYDRLPREGTLTVCDLCCGKSYLTFAVYYYLTEIQKRTVRMYGVDLKADVIAYCNGLAAELGCEGLTFHCQDVSTFSPDSRVDMVVSLHACDIATDLVIDFAVQKQARVLLSTPCCHHEMMRQLDCRELSFISAHSMLKQKLCDAATDALRGLKLEAHGYNVDMPELIDAEETPKNLMIRATLAERIDPVKCKLARERYRAAAAFLGVKPYRGLLDEIE